MKKVLGIDEAGRGPVIGPMVIAGVMVEEGHEKKLGEVADSKLLSQKKRIILNEKIKENSVYKIIVLEPEIIDAAVLSGELNLNWLEAYKQADIINELNPDKAIIDCPSINEKAYKAYLKKLIKNQNIELVVEHKADLNYKTCSAASIIAKVEREHQMGNIKREYGNTGSGYPADPDTQKFLKENWNKYPKIFRKSWSTYKRFSEKKIKKQKSLGEF